MDNSYSSYADSGDSSPRSREIDCENQSWEDPSSTAAATNYRVKFMCSYNGKIQPRPHDNQLTYVGGETKILAVDRNSKYVTVVGKLSAICDFDTVNLKYQLPGEDLDALVSVTNDEDLEHMMVEYDRLNRSRLRLFLFPVFPVNSKASSLASSAKDGGSSKSNQQWFVDALNSSQIQHSIETPATSPPACETPTNPDFLFGLDNINNNNNNNQKGVVSPPAISSPVKAKHDLVQEQQQLIQEQQSQIQDHNREDHRILVGEHAEIQRQIQELQKLQISNQEQQQQTLTSAFAGDYYVHQIPENTIPAGNIPVTLPQVSPPSVPAPAAVGYWQERHIAPPPVSVADHQVYLIPTPTGYYQAQAPPQNVLQVPGQGYYAPPPPVYREHPVYNVAPQQPQQHQQQVQPRIVALADGSYAQVGYDSAGRQVYYAAPKQPSPGGVMPTPYQTVAIGGVVGGGGAMDLRQQQQQPNLASNPEVKLLNLKPAQAAAI